MADWDELTDDELMAMLGEAVAEGADEAVVRRRDAARAAFTWRTVDEELAELLHDSALDAGAAVRSSAGGSPRSLSFGRSGLALEVEVDGDRVLGQVIAEGAAAADAVATVTLRRPDVEDVVVEADTSGFFRFSGVGAGPARFVVEQAGWSLVTPWVTL